MRRASLPLLQALRLRLHRLGSDAVGWPSIRIEDGGGWEVLGKAVPKGIAVEPRRKCRGTEEREGEKGIQVDFQTGWKYMQYR